MCLGVPTACCSSLQDAFQGEIKAVNGWAADLICVLECPVPTAYCASIQDAFQDKGSKWVGSGSYMCFGVSTACCASIQDVCQGEVKAINGWAAI
jgi:hypothetical protein